MEAVDSASDAKYGYLERWAVGKTALDLGCGAGWYSGWFSKNGFAVTGIDHAAPSYRFNGEFLTADLEKPWPLSGRVFDTVLAFDVMEHVANEDSFLAQLRACCAKRLVVSVPQTDPGAFRPYNLAYFHYTDRTHQRTYTPQELREKLELNGFRVVFLREEGPVWPHVIAVFARWEWFGRVLSKIAGLLLKIGLLKAVYNADIFAVAEPV